MSHIDYLGKSTAGRGTSHCKGSEAGIYVACLSKQKEASMAEFREEQGKPEVMKPGRENWADGVDPYPPLCGHWLLH